LILARKVRLTNAFKRVLKKKPPRLQAAILACVEQLGEDITHPGLRVHKMQGVGEIWEAYVDRANRVTFEWEGDTLVIRMNCNHQMLARNP
jgi:mRNA interferase RelE/StbE